MYKLTIITINKNNSSGLEKTCLSVSTQTFKKIEWIVIDGASEDNSIEIIKQFSDNINYWVSEIDSGIYNAMNKGIIRATGEYILFLNSGDCLLHPWTLHDVINEIIISEYADIYFSDSINDKYFIRKYPKIITTSYLINRNICHQNSLIRRELFNYNLYDENFKIISDWYFSISMLINYNIKFYHLKTYISLYNTEGISSINCDLLQEEKNIILRKFNNKLKKKNYFYVIFKFIKLIKYILPHGLYKLFFLLKQKYMNKYVY